jgi:hypothetical protein
MKAIVPVAAGLALLFAGAAGAQQQPNYSGTWVLDGTRSESAAQNEPIAPITLVVQQGPSDLTIERRQGETNRTVRYRADGTETISSLGASDQAVGKLRWEGPMLVTETVYQLRGIPMAQTQVHSLSSDGREMTIETRLLVMHGYEGVKADELVTAPNYSKGKDVYVRR